MNKPTIDSNAVMQVCFVTDRLDETMNWFSELTGRPRPDINQTPQDGVEADFRGAQIVTGFRQAIFDFDNVAVEFIEPAPGPSTWREWLDEHGASVHHIAFRTRDMKGRTTRFEEAGHGLIQRGEFAGGRYAYFDTSNPLGTLIELLEFDADGKS